METMTTYHCHGTEDHLHETDAAALGCRADQDAEAAALERYNEAARADAEEDARDAEDVSDRPVACCDWFLLANPESTATRATSARTCASHFLPDGTLPDPDATAASPCFCEGPWRHVDPADRPETVLGREHALGGPGCKAGRI